METADYAHAAFLAEQAAQKSLKALLRVGHRNARTHELPELLQNIVRVLKLERSADLEAAAASLREHYTGARYPGVRSRMAPSDFYTKEMAQEALECCDKIMEFVRAQLAPTFPDIEQA
jgi:HEPN domain-containing protein